MPVEVILPKIDEAMTEGKILEWLVKEGEEVEAGTILFTLETEKVTWEVESPAAGILSKHLAEAGDIIKVGEIVAYILHAGEEIPQAKEDKTSSDKERDQETTDDRKDAGTPVRVMSPSNKIKASPIAKKIARDHHIDLTSVAGTGPEGRIKKIDVMNYLEREKKTLETPQGEEKRSAEYIELSSMRKTIARRMTESFQSVPHFFLTVEIDTGELKNVKEKLAKNIEDITSKRLTYTDLFIKIVSKSVESNPDMNVQWTDDGILRLSEINIGIAVNVANGLVVPVLRETGKKSLAEITLDRFDLVERAREGKLLPNEMKGGSLTISNLGMYGIDHLCPIINPPESCILGIGQTVERPVSQDGEIAIRPITKFTLSIDHRVLDGAIGSRFLQSIRMLTENPLLLI